MRRIGPVQAAVNARTGTDIGDLLELDDVGGSSGLPAVDGSQLTGVSDATLTTDGDILHYSTGNARLPIGAAGEVLTVAAGQPSWAAAAAGGYADFVTVGTSGDYATVNAAIVAGKNHIVLLSNVTEAATSAVPAAGMILDLNGFILTMGNFAFTTAGAYPIYVVGNGGEIDYTHTTTTALFDVFAGTVVNIRHAVIDNNSTAAAPIATPTNAIWQFAGVEVRCSNTSYGDVYENRAGDEHSFVDISIVGGGASCVAGFYIRNSRANNLRFSGTFSATGCALFDTKCVVSGVIFDASVVTKANYACPISNVVFPGTSAVTFTLQTLNAGGFLRGVATHENLTLSVGNDHTVIEDVRAASFSGKTVTLSITGNRTHIARVIVDVAFTQSSLMGTFDDCVFLAGVTIPTGADDNGFSNCRFGADAGGGVTTITIQAGSNRTRVTGCTTDAAISDAGTGSSLTGNTVY